METVDHLLLIPIYQRLPMLPSLLLLWDLALPLALLLFLDAIAIAAIQPLAFGMNLHHKQINFTPYNDLRLLQAPLRAHFLLAHGLKAKQKTTMLTGNVQRDAVTRESPSYPSDVVILKC